MLNKYRDVLTVKELAEALGIGMTSAYRLINEGVIGSTRVGKKILVPKVCVADYLNSARYVVLNDNGRQLS